MNQGLFDAQWDVIVIGTAQEDAVHDFETALLGSHIERWDAYPPQGRRVAHGRGEDGFWSGSRHDQSRAVGWCLAGPDRPAPSVRLWEREDPPLDPAHAEGLRRIFPAPGVRG